MITSLVWGKDFISLGLTFLKCRGLEDSVNGTPSGLLSVGPCVLLSTWGVCPVSGTVLAWPGQPVPRGSEVSPHALRVRQDPPCSSWWPPRDAAGDPSGLHVTEPRRGVHLSHHTLDSDTRVIQFPGTNLATDRRPAVLSWVLLCVFLI